MLVFGQLRVWDTEGNNGVLIYLLIADRDVEIVADRAIAARVPQADWDAVCRDMEDAFPGGPLSPRARRPESTASARCSRGTFRGRAGIATNSRTRPSFSERRGLQASVW